MIFSADDFQANAAAEVTGTIGKAVDILSRVNRPATRPVVNVIPCKDNGQCQHVREEFSAYEKRTLNQIVFSKIDGSFLVRNDLSFFSVLFFAFDFFVGFSNLFQPALTDKIFSLTSSIFVSGCGTIGL